MDGIELDRYIPSTPIRSHSALIPTSMSAHTILCHAHPELEDVWTHHLMPFLLPHSQPIRNWMSCVVSNELQRKLDRGLRPAFDTPTNSVTWVNKKGQKFVRIWWIRTRTLYTADVIGWSQCDQFLLDSTNNTIKIEWFAHIPLVRVMNDLTRCALCGSTQESFVQCRWVARLFEIVHNNQKWMIGVCISCLNATNNLGVRMVIDQDKYRCWNIRVASSLPAHADVCMVTNGFYVNAPFLQPDTLSTLRDAMVGWRQIENQGGLGYLPYEHNPT